MGALSMLNVELIRKHIIFKFVSISISKNRQFHVFVSKQLWSDCD